MRTAIYVYDRGIFLCLIKVCRQYHAVIEVRLAVCRLDAAAPELGNSISCLLPRISSRQQVLSLARCRTQQVYAARDIRSSIALYNLRSAAVEQCIVAYALGLSYQCAPAATGPDAVQARCTRVCLVAQVNQALGHGIETYEFLHYPVAACQLPYVSAPYVQQIQVVVPVTLALHHSLRIVPWQESQWIHRLDILLVTFLQYGPDGLACCNIVGNKAHVVLVPVQLKDINRPAVG